MNNRQSKIYNQDHCQFNGYTFSFFFMNETKVYDIQKSNVHDMYTHDTHTALDGRSLRRTQTRLITPFSGGDSVAR